MKFVSCVKISSKTRRGFREENEGKIAETQIEIAESKQIRRKSSLEQRKTFSINIVNATRNLLTYPFKSLKKL